MALTTASNSNPAIQNQQQLLPILRFWNEYGVSVRESGDMFRLNTSKSIDGFDTTRTYPTFDMAALAIIQHVTASGLVTIAA